jgi:hypothetical protein
MDSCHTWDCSPVRPDRVRRGRTTATKGSSLLPSALRGRSTRTCPKYAPVLARARVHSTPIDGSWLKGARSNEPDLKAPAIVSAAELDEVRNASASLEDRFGGYVQSSRLVNPSRGPLQRPPRCCTRRTYVSGAPRPPVRVGSSELPPISITRLSCRKGVASLSITATLLSPIRDKRDIARKLMDLLKSEFDCGRVCLALLRFGSPPKVQTPNAFGSSST